VFLVLEPFFIRSPFDLFAPAIFRIIEVSFFLFVGAPLPVPKAGQARWTFFAAPFPAAIDSCDFKIRATPPIVAIPPSPVLQSPLESSCRKRTERIQSAPPFRYLPPLPDASAIYLFFLFEPNNGYRKVFAAPNRHDPSFTPFQTLRAGKRFPLPAFFSCWPSPPQ